MRFFDLQPQWITLSILVLELVLLTAQVVCLLCRPQEKRLIWQVLLLSLFLVKNGTETLFQYNSSQLRIPIWQIFFSHSLDHAIAAYFAVYWHKTLDLKNLKFYGQAGALFILIPLILVYSLSYLTSQNSASALAYIDVIPASYGIFMFLHVCRAIHTRYIKDRDRRQLYARILIFTTTIPWTIAPLVKAQLTTQSQELIDIVLNIGLLILSLFYIRHSVKQSRTDGNKIKELETKLELHRFGAILSQEKFKAQPIISPTSFPSPIGELSNTNKSEKELLEQAYRRYRFTQAEIRIVKAFHEGLNRKMIANSLNIDLKTVETHLTSIYKKAGIMRIEAGISKRDQLLDKLNQTEKIPPIFPPLEAN